MKVTVGGVSYTFDPKTAELTGASVGGTTVVTGSRLTIWRELNSTEALTLGRDVKAVGSPDLNQYSTTVKNWEVEKADGEVRLSGDVENVTDAKDAFAAG